MLSVNESCFWKEQVDVASGSGRGTTAEREMDPPLRQTTHWRLICVLVTLKGKIHPVFSHQVLFHVVLPHTEPSGSVPLCLSTL